LGEARKRKDRVPSTGFVRTQFCNQNLDWTEMVPRQIILLRGEFRKKRRRNSWQWELKAGNESLKKKF